MVRSVWLKHVLSRATAPNSGTLRPLRAPLTSRPSARPAPPRESFEELFDRHYPAIRNLLLERSDPGLGLIVVGPDGLEATARYAAVDGDINPLILGRHSATEVFLPTDRNLSLRHLAVVLHPRRSGERARFRVVDLRTRTGFSDEEGRPLQALDAQGPLMLRCASYSLLFFPTGGPRMALPEEARKAWAGIPARQYLERRTALPDRVLGRERLTGAAPLRPTVVTTLPGPVFATPLLPREKGARGEVVVTSPSGRVSLALGGERAQQGLLLGRSGRCDTAGLPILASDALSRVHVLLLDVAGSLYAIDTASNNGSWAGNQRIRSVRIDRELNLRMADHALVQWVSFH